MKKSRFTENQIVGILKEADSGIPVNGVWRKHGISSATYDKWKSKYSGVDVSELARVKELESKNSRLKRMYAELAMRMKPSQPNLIRAINRRFRNWIGVPHDSAYEVP